MGKKLSLFLFCALFFLSCEETEETGVGRVLEFHPRECNYVYGLLGCTLTEEQVQAYNEANIYNDGYRADIQKDSVYSADRVLLLIYTTDRSRDSLFNAVLYSIFIVFSEDIENDFTAPHLPVLENQLTKSFERTIIPSDRTRAIDEPSFLQGPLRMEYRTDAVRNLTISSLDATLFGHPAGTPLNDYFEIDAYQPDFIASSLTQGLVFDRFEKKPKTIREWLYYSPLASPGIFLRFSSVPPELPVSTRFVVTMETDKKVLRDTSQIIHLVR